MTATCTSQLLMIEPVRFGFNPQTAVNNLFQQNTHSQVQENALREFRNFVSLLRENEVDVLVIQDTDEPFTPDSIFPNNWISFHKDNSIVLYPMFAENRRLERKQTVMDTLHAAFHIKTIHNYTNYELEGIFLEGTGSMVLDRNHKIAYACYSPRTNKALFEKWCTKHGYLPAGFHATDSNSNSIYHTNVMMCIGSRFAVICLNAIASASERSFIETLLTKSHKEIIPIGKEQMHCFAGNMLEIQNKKGEQLLAMSQQAYDSLTQQQISKLNTHARILYSDLHSIESAGGGSARCMMAEVFNSPK